MANWLIPPGVIAAYGGPAATKGPPTGWAYCNGASVPNTSGSSPDYAALFSVIGTSFGGDGNPNFNLPDFRGYFLRGVDDGAGRDPNSNQRTSPLPSGSGGNAGDNVGSIEGYATQVLSAQVPVQFSPSKSGSNATFGYSEHNIVGGIIDTQPTGLSQAATTTPSGAETRPLNAYVYYLISLGTPMPSSS